jgi:hypothetical protein
MSPHSEGLVAQRDAFDSAPENTRWAKSADKVIEK